MSPIAKRTTTEYPGTDTESFERHTNELLTHWIEVEPEDFADFVKLTKATWFCEVAEA